MSRIPPHRKKVKLCNDPGDAHFSTFSCFHRLPLLSKDRTRHWFLSSLADARVKHAFDLWAWVVMPEHVHLLLYPRLPVYDMSAILRDIKQPVGRRAISYLRRRAPWFLHKLAVVHRNRTYYRFWQSGPGYDENVNDANIIREILDYIHQNPVRRGLVEKAEDWFWSSARDWVGLDSPFIRVDRTLPMVYVIGE